MPAYVIAEIEVQDPEKYEEYRARVPATIAAHGGKYLVRGPAAENMKGDALKGKVVIITEFPSMDELNGFVNDETYVNEIAPLRDGTGIYNFASYEASPPMP